MALVSSSARHSMNCSTHPTASGIAGSGVGGLICRVESRGGVPGGLGTAKGNFLFKKNVLH